MIAKLILRDKEYEVKPGMSLLDALKKINIVPESVIATRDASGNYYGNEYLQLYRRIDQTTAGNSLYWYPKGSSSPQFLTSY